MFTFTHSTIEHIYIPFLGYVMDYIFSLWYIIAQMYLQPNKCNVVVIVGLKILVDLFDMLCTSVVYITYVLITWAIRIFLIYMPLPWSCGSRAWAYISGKSLLPML